MLKYVSSKWSGVFTFGVGIWIARQMVTFGRPESFAKDDSIYWFVFVPLGFLCLAHVLMLIYLSYPAELRSRDAVKSSNVLVVIAILDALFINSFFRVQSMRPLVKMDLLVFVGLNLILGIMWFAAKRREKSRD